ncbi:MAG: TraB/GumN family protein [Candidatus Omnitrophota bacterium]|nr:TraB/GumN family protein [Candidatus Omnitrophota bacterium]
MRRYNFLIISVFLSLAYFPSSVFGETVILKSGKRVEGKILEKTDKYVKVDFRGVILTWRHDEIEHIEPEDNAILPKMRFGFAPGDEPSETEPWAGFGPPFSLSNQKSFLWKVKSGLGKVYLLGSIHVAKSNLYPLDKKIEDAFSASDVLVTELNLISPGLDATLRFMEKGIYPAGKTLDRVLSSETMDLIKIKTKNLGMDFAEVNTYKPWFLALQLMGLELVRMGFNPDYGIDMHFLKKAEGNKETLELETFEYQLGLFESLTDKEQELFLLSTLQDLDLLASEVDKMTKIWKVGDTAAMEAMLDRALSKNPETGSMYEKMIFERNKNMVLGIERLLLSGKSAFVIVGSAHLIGSRGIVEKLREKGCSVEQL